MYPVSFHIGLTLQVKKKPGMLSLWVILFTSHLYIVPLRQWEEGPTKRVQVSSWTDLQSNKILASFVGSKTDYRLYYYTDEHNLNTMARVSDDATFDTYFNIFPLPTLRVYTGPESPSGSPEPSDDDSWHGVSGISSRASSVLM
jgi:hypothetical protein